jgi:hypothetical protein
VELYQRVWAEQFILTKEQKASIMRGEKVYWQDAYVRQNGPTRFHVLLHIVDQERPVYENQWLVKVSGQTLILWDHEVKSKYLVAIPQTAEEAQPVQSEALKRFLARSKEKEEAKEPAAESEPVSPLLDEFMKNGTILQPVAETVAQPTDLKEVEHGEFSPDEKGEINGVQLVPGQEAAPQ